MTGVKSESDVFDPKFTFPRLTCPCGSWQLDPDRLYCETCRQEMSIAFKEAYSWGDHE